MSNYTPYRRIIFTSILLFTACLSGRSAGAVTVPVGQHPQRNPFYGEVLYYSFQQNYFTALSRLMAARQQGLLNDQADAVELLSRWLHLTSDATDKAGPRFSRLLKKQLSPGVRDEIWFDLGRAFFLRGDYPAAEAALRHSHEALTGTRRKAYPPLLAQILMAQNEYQQAADVLQSARKLWDWTPFARYNLGIALYQAGEQTAGLTQLESLGQRATTDPVLQALRDQANVTLGQLYLKNSQPRMAKIAFKRVQLQGPYARQALLGLGWAEWNAGKARAAQLAWSELLGTKDDSDPRVQEALLGIPQSLWQLQSHTLATKKFRETIDIYQQQLRLLNQAIARAGKGIWQTRLLTRNGQMPVLQHAWKVIGASPLAHYLQALLYAPRFRATLQSYQHLDELATRISAGARRLSILKTRPGAAVASTSLRQLDQRRQQLQRDIEQNRQQHARLLQKLITTELQRQRLQLAQRLIDARLFLARLLDELAGTQDSIP